MASVVNINEVLDGHVGLQVECVDRLYLNAYCPLLQVGGQVVQFLTGHLGPSDPVSVVVSEVSRISRPARVDWRRGWRSEHWVLRGCPTLLLIENPEVISRDSAGVLAVAQSWFIALM
jgi:hypothetical protein